MTLIRISLIILGVLSITAFTWASILSVAWPGTKTSRNLVRVAMVCLALVACVGVSITVAGIGNEEKTETVSPTRHVADYNSAMYAAHQAKVAEIKERMKRGTQIAQ